MTREKPENCREFFQKRENLGILFNFIILKKKKIAKSFLAFKFLFFFKKKTFFLLSTTIYKYISLMAGGRGSK